MTWSGSWYRADVGPFVVRLVAKGPPAAWALDIYVFGTRPLTNDKTLLGRLGLDYTARHIKTKQPTVWLRELVAPGFGERYSRQRIGTLLMNTAIQYLNAQGVADARVTGTVGRHADPEEEPARSQAWRARVAFFAGFNLRVDGVPGVSTCRLQGHVGELCMQRNKWLFDRFPAWVALSEFVPEARTGRPQELL